MAITKKKNVKKQKAVNPFELKFNKSKHEILGRKKGAQVGAPTASRKRAYEQREKTLGVEYDRKNKISKIIDKRLGERDGEKTEEEKGAMRFTEERVKNYKRASKFNLADDFGEIEGEDVLTHKGKALSDIEKYDKSMISDSDEDDEPGNLGSHMVKVAHFGGGEKTAEEHVKEKISREDMISNLIAKTKLARHEKQQAKDELELMTDSLDEKYKNLMSKMMFRPPGRQQVEKDDYDKLTISLKMEADARATPSDRKLSEEEEAAKEKERLDSLEAARISKNNAKFNSGSHLSADADVDIDAGSKADMRKMKAKNARFEVRFDDDGAMVEEDGVERLSTRKVGEEDSDEEMEDEFEDEEEDLDDLMEDEDELEDDEEEQEIPKKSSKKTEETVPFTFEMPKNYRKFCDLLEKYAKDMELVLERLMKCHHPSLKEGNKKKLNKMFLMCLRWFDDMTKEELTEQTVKEIDLAQRTLHALMKFDIQYGVRCIRALIRQHWKGRQEKQKTAPCSFGLISAVRLVSGLFPVADSWHPVVVPAFFLATEALGYGRIPNLTALARQLVLATTLVEYMSESKRYVPELVSFARSALLLAVPDDKKPVKFSTNGFPISKPHSEMLCVTEKHTSPLAPISLSEIFGENPPKNEKSLKITVLRAIISLIQQLRVLYSNQNDNYHIIFGPFLRIFAEIPREMLGKEVGEELETLEESMRAEKKRLVNLSLIKTEKSMLKMLEPRFEWDFDPERPHKGAKDEKKKMTKNLKNEMRGAIKELRKDTAFLARKQMRSVKAKDRARDAATKRVMGGLMQQQGEWNKEKRTNEVEKKKK